MLVACSARISALGVWWLWSLQADSALINTRLTAADRRLPGISVALIAWLECFKRTNCVSLRSSGFAFRDFAEHAHKGLGILGPWHLVLVVEEKRRHRVDIPVQPLLLFCAHILGEALV